MRKKPTRKRPYFKMESAMTAILRDASGKMHHGILFDHHLFYRIALHVRTKSRARSPIFIFELPSQSESRVCR